MDSQNLPAPHSISQIEKQRRVALPYCALDVKCPRCGSYSGRRCQSSKRKLLTYPHFQRVEVAAERFRAEARRQILEQVRRHPFALAFSTRRMAVEGFSARKASALSGEELRGPRLCSGRRGAAPSRLVSAR